MEQEGNHREATIDYSKPVNQQRSFKKKIKSEKLVNLIQTQPVERRGTGVVIAAKPEWQLEPLIPEFWTDCTCACLAQKRTPRGLLRLIVVGHYSKHMEQDEQDEKLNFLIKNLY